MPKTLRLQIMTPDKTVFDGEAGFVLLRTSGGDMGVLPGHEPYGAVLARGEVRAFNGQEQVAAFEVRGGFAAIEDDKVAVLTGLAGPPEEMEALLAGMERERAQRKEREEAANLEMRRAEEALRRALVHMEVSDDVLLKGREEQFGEG
jgi:F-type H+-transporting ATPase subunit epsilon